MTTRRRPHGGSSRGLFRGSLALLLPIALVLGCGDSTSPPDEVRQPGELNLLRVPPGAPALATSDTTFWAVRGENRELRLFYEPEEGEDSGREFLRFRVDARSLVTRPDGTVIPEGDSLEIHVRVVDPATLEVEFEPSGLRFDPAEPAELRIRYAEADDDYNEDGAVDDDDARIEQTFSLWRQETAGDPWVKVGSVVLEDLEEVEGEISGFTHYIVAY